jgi:antibiotic biosynthesis monooxygenase (ABM) superfamily enzyme
MTRLPRLLQKAPRIFYALAVLFAVYDVIEPLMEMNQNLYFGGESDFMRFAYVRLVANAIYKSLFLFGFGVLADLLIVIWHNTRIRNAEES